MRPDNRRKDQIARIYNRLIGEGYAPGEATYRLAVERLHSLGGVFLGAWADA